MWCHRVRPAQANPGRITASGTAKSTASGAAVGTAAGVAVDPGGDTALRAALGVALGVAIVQLRRLRSRVVRGAAASAWGIRRRRQARSR